MKTYPPLTAYKITYNNGSSYVTDMAANVTLDMAKDYFLGQRITQADEQTILTVTNVEQVIAPVINS